MAFSWNTGPSWQIEANPANRSEVEVHFTSQGAGRTRVELDARHSTRRPVHRPLSQLEPALQIQSIEVLLSPPVGALRFTGSAELRMFSTGRYCAEACLLALSSALFHRSLNGLGAGLTAARTLTTSWRRRI